MIRAEGIIRGDRIGKRANDYYIGVPCPKCHNRRWVLRWKLKLPNFTGLCQLCNGRRNKSRWNNGTMTSSNGYVCISKPEHPNANAQGYVRRSRLVLEQKLGRQLRDGCIPHHLNGVVDDDRPKNLIEILSVEHPTLHAAQRKLMRESRREVVEWQEKNLELFWRSVSTTKHDYYIPLSLADTWQAQLKEWGL